MLVVDRYEEILLEHLNDFLDMAHTAMNVRIELAILVHTDSKVSNADSAKVSNFSSEMMKQKLEKWQKGSKKFLKKLESRITSLRDDVMGRPKSLDFLNRRPEDQKREPEWTVNMFHHVRMVDVRMQASDMKRLARRVTGCAIGLVLGGEKHTHVARVLLKLNLRWGCERHLSCGSDCSSRRRRNHRGYGGCPRRVLLSFHVANTQVGGTSIGAAMAGLYAKHPDNFSNFMQAAKRLSEYNKA